MAQQDPDEVSKILYTVAVGEEQEIAQEHQQELSEKTRKASRYSKTQGERSRNRKRKVDCSVTCAKKTTEFKSFHGKERGTNCRSHMCSESHQELGAENCTQGESGLTKPDQSNLCQGPSSMEVSDKFNDCESNLSNAHPLTCQQNTHVNVRPYACHECGHVFKTKQDLTRHQHIHSEEKSYHCAECDKRFSRKQHIVEHMRIHTGERPYKCIECEKTFGWKKNFNRHKKTHMVT